MYSTSSRKRGRSPPEDPDECMPISKRINKLYIEQNTEENREELQQRQRLADSCSGQASPETVDIADQWKQLAVSAGGPPGMPVAGQSNMYIPHGAPQHVGAAMPGGSGGQGGADDIVCLEDLSSYEPELGENDNPHYYKINETLFKACVDRTFRRRNPSSDVFNPS